MISSSDSSVAALISAAIFNGAIAIALSILYFAYFRNKFRNVYFASSSPSSSSENEDMDIIKSHGLDSLLYIKYMNLGVVLFIPIAILACVILFPSYIIGQNEATGLSYLSIANISDTNRLWANWAISVFISLLVLFIVRMYLYEFLTLRSHFLNTTQTQKTLLIEDIKAEYQKEENLASLFQGVVSVEFQVLATKSGKLGKKIVKRDEMLNKTEAAIVAILKNVEKNKPRPKAAPKLFAKKADALHLYASKMEQLSNKIHDLQNELVKGSIASSNSTSAFVTFQNAVLAHAALNNSSAKAHCTMRHVSTCASDVYWVS